jgi:DNA-binding transcriptional regulator YiaG
MAFHQDYLGVAQPTIGPLLRALRQTLPLTQAKFAAPLGVSFPTSQRWENGCATPLLLALKQIELLLHPLAKSSALTLRAPSQRSQGKDVRDRTLQA